jgi:membrane protease YdiL (CAAX protease family)
VNKGNVSGTQAVIAGAVIGLIFGCLITWYPIRLSFCASYNAPDCEEIVLMVFPLYCLITPLLGSLIAHLLYRKYGEQE